jgi:large subunit ribosomal protein L22
MGARKRNAANERKEMMKVTALSRLTNCPTSPRKMRLVADMIRGKRVETALNSLRFSTKEAAGRLEKVLLSAISNWQAKNEGQRIEDHDLFVKEVYVDSARQLKRLRTAPQGRGHRIRKRSNHITLILDTKEQIAEVNTTTETNS